MEGLNPPEGGDRDRGSVILGVTWTLTLISIIFVSLRMYSRVRLVQRIWWDDWLAVIAIACASPLPIIWIFYIREGGARHVYYLTAEQRSQAVRLNWVSQPFGIMAIGIAKASVAFTILRFQAPNKWRTRVLYFISLSVNILNVLVCIFTFAQCDPPRALWNHELAATAKCWDPAVFAHYTIAVASYSAALDFILVFISTTIVWNLKLSVSRRIQLAALLGTGILDGAFGIVKATTLTTQSARSDYTWDTYLLFIWTIAELHGIIIGCCLPTLRPLYLIIFRRPGRETYTSKSHRAGYKFKDSAPHSYNSNTRRAPIEINNLSSEDIYMPVISPHGNRREAGWVTKPENVMAAYHPI